MFHSQTNNFLGCDEYAIKIIRNRFSYSNNISKRSGVLLENWNLPIMTPIPKVLRTIKREEFIAISAFLLYEKLLELVVTQQLLWNTVMKIAYVSLTKQ